MRPPLGTRYKHLQYLWKYDRNDIIKIVSFKDYVAIGGGGQNEETLERAYTLRLKFDVPEINTANSFAFKSQYYNDLFWAAVICDRHF